MYLNGLGVDRDVAIAKRMYERGIEFGHNRGKVGLGDIYLYTESDYKKAFELYRQGCEMQEPEAKCRMAMFYYYSDLAESIGEECDPSKTSDLIGSNLDEAANSQDINVLCMTSAYCCHLHDTGQKLDHSKNPSEVACELLYKAGKRYEVVKLMRQYKIARFTCRYLKYDNFIVYTIVTEGIQYNYTDLQKGEMLYIYAMFAHEYDDINYKMNWGYTAAEAMEKSALYGYTPAQKIIGDWYANGTHTAKNLLKAREWYDKAKANGEEVPE